MTGVVKQFRPLLKRTEKKFRKKENRWREKIFFQLELGQEKWNFKLITLMVVKNVEEY